MEPGGSKGPLNVGISAGFVGLDEQSIEEGKRLAASKKLWNLTAIGAYAAQRHADGSGVGIAIVNSGIDHNHPEIGSCFDPGNLGYNFVERDKIPIDKSSLCKSINFCFSCGN